MAYCLYAACCSRQGGIAVLDGTEEGTLSLRQMATADRPMYMAMDGGKLLTLLLAPEGCGGDSALTAFPQEKDGRLRPHGELRSTGGVEACHLAARGGRVWCANYGTGSAALLEGETRRLAVFEGQGPHRDRQEAAHIHQVAFTPDGEFLAAVDLGSDSLLLLDAELRLKNRTALPAGSGPRHLAFSPDGRFAWCVNELASTVTALAYEPGRFHVLQTVPALPAEMRPAENYPAAIRVSRDGRRVFVSNRGADVITVFEAEGEALRLTQAVPWRRGLAPGHPADGGRTVPSGRQRAEPCGDGASPPGGPSVPPGERSVPPRALGTAGIYINIYNKKARRTIAVRRAFHSVLLAAPALQLSLLGQAAVVGRLSRG